MLTFDAATRASLNGAASKIQWTQTLGTALGNTRRIRCFRDANAAAVDAFATGTEFRNVGSTGAMTTQAGRIVKLGQIKGTTVSLAASMTSGASILRIEGNGRFMQGTLGLSAAAQIARGVLASAVVQYDFTVRGDFTASNGLGVAANFNVAGYRFLPSGVGPAAPAKVATAPHTLELQSWANPAAPVVVSTTTLDIRNEDYTLQDAEMATIFGDTAWWSCNNSLMFGDYELAPHLFISHPGNTEIGTLPLYEMDYACAYRGAWVGYPDKTNYDFKNHQTCPPPFKIIAKDANGAVLYTSEMRDGKSINDPTIASQLGTRTATAAQRPKWNIQMGLRWENTRPKVHAFASKLYPGIADGFYRDSQAKQHFAVTSTEPMFTGGYGNNSMNGMAHMFAVPQWPLPRAPYTPTTADPFISYIDFNQDGRTAFAAPWTQGWGYEPGSMSTHNWYTGPGGPRFDRCVIPSVFAMFMTFPAGNRLQDTTPWKDMAHNFRRAYANHSNKFYSDPKKLYLDTNANLLNGTWSTAGQYYGDAGPTPKNIRINGAQRDGTDATHLDIAGNMVNSGWGRDPLHNYGNEGWGALLFASPMAAISSKNDMHYTMMLHSAQRSQVSYGYYMVRTMAWEFMHYPIAWKLASSSPLGFTKNEIEDRFAFLLGKIYDQVYVPLHIDNSQLPFFVSLRNLGVSLQDSDSDATKYNTPGGQLGYYMSHVFQLMKQTGFWSAMYSKGGRIKLVLDMIMGHFDKFCLDRVLDTNMIAPNGTITLNKADPIPASWAAYQNGGGPNFLPNWYQNADGTVKDGAHDVSDALVVQWAYMRRDYFPEFTHPRLAAAITKFDAYETLKRDAVAAAADNNLKRNKDYSNRVPGVCVIKAPAAGNLGPA